MKCPKCQYLGFDTGDRCRNCGYNFSLSTTPAAPAAEFSADDLPLHQGSAGVAVVDHVADVPLAPAPAVAIAPQATADPSTALPLFAGDRLDDSPLVKLPRAPRAPLAVRKTPEIPRIKVAPGSRRREPRAVTPQLDLPPVVESAAVEPAGKERAAAPRTASADRTARPALVWRDAPACALSARLSAMMVDLGILFAIDLAVFYFTLRIAQLTPGEWRLLPLVPFLLFLLVLKVLYYWAFTAIGGQTIGKMAMRIRVVADEGAAVDPARAFSRTLTAVASPLTLGATFLPALFGGDRRPVHDRLAHTRVVTLPGA